VFLYAQLSNIQEFISYLRENIFFYYKDQLVNSAWEIIVIYSGNRTKPTKKYRVIDRKHVVHIITIVS
jgi:hypothetical protein